MKGSELRVVEGCREVSGKRDGELTLVIGNPINGFVWDWLQNPTSHKPREMEHPFD
jgi:hypothetical protein